MNDTEELILDKILNMMTILELQNVQIKEHKEEIETLKEIANSLEKKTDVEIYKDSQLHYLFDPLKEYNMNDSNTTMVDNSEYIATIERLAIIEEKIKYVIEKLDKHDKDLYNAKLAMLELATVYDKNFGILSRRSKKDSGFFSNFF